VNYNYEKGVLARIPISWNEAKQTLTFGTRTGLFPGMLAQRTFRITWVQSGHGVGITPAAKTDAEILYTGEKVVLHP
jgi:alpha-D-xyloside xylohydrolase